MLIGGADWYKDLFLNRPPNIMKLLVISAYTVNFFIQKIKCKQKCVTDNIYDDNQQYGDYLTWQDGYELGLNYNLS